MQWECLLVDNASTSALRPADWLNYGPANLRVIVEPELGLSHARRRGFTVAQGSLLVLVDDDNVLAPDYLAQVIRVFSTHPRLGAIGGKSLPEFETPPAIWVREFDGLLACRDLGTEPILATQLWHEQSHRNEYPLCAPIGAGMALRREAAQAWLDAGGPAGLPDRRGNSLSSSGDNDIILCAMTTGWAVGYFPTLQLTHLIPAARTTPAYLARLNRGIQESWMRVLTRHRVNPWPSIAPATVWLRQIKAWFAYRAWSGPPAYIRWQGACGHFEGRASLNQR